jgi:hypothetical protein
MKCGRAGLLLQNQYRSPRPFSLSARNPPSFSLFFQLPARNRKRCEERLET